MPAIVAIPFIAFNPSIGLIWEETNTTDKEKDTSVIRKALFMAGTLFFENSCFKSIILKTIEEDLGIWRWWWMKSSSFRSDNSKEQNFFRVSLFFFWADQLMRKRKSLHYSIHTIFYYEIDE
jgi:hypothetical protein